MGERFEPVDLYDSPLHYDIVFDEGSKQEADFLCEIQARYAHVRGSCRFLEPACGTGRLILEMASRGIPSQGFDVSQPMLEYARARAHARGLEVELWLDRMEAFAPLREKVTLAASLISSFKYLHSEAAAKAHLERVASSLQDGGLFVLGLHLTDYERDRPVHERWVAKRGEVEVTCNTRTWPADRRRRRERLRNRLTIRNARTGEIRRQESTWEFRTYDASQMRRLLKRVPALTLITAYDFGYDPGDERALDDSQEDIVLVLRKEKA